MFGLVEVEDDGFEAPPPHYSVSGGGSRACIRSEFDCCSWSLVQTRAQLLRGKWKSLQNHRCVEKNFFSSFFFSQISVQPWPSALSTAAWGLVRWKNIDECQRLKFRGCALSLQVETEFLPNKKNNIQLRSLFTMNGWKRAGSWVGAASAGTQAFAQITSGNGAWRQIPQTSRPSISAFGRRPNEQQRGFKWLNEFPLDDDWVCQRRGGWGGGAAPRTLRWN